MIRHPMASSCLVAPFLAVLFAGAAVPFADASAPTAVERAHADGGWQSQDYVRFARGDLAGELVTVAADPGAEVVLAKPLTAATGLRQFSHNVGAERIGHGSARVDTLADPFFWQAYRLPAKGESCAAFDQKDPGRSVAFGYLCRKGELLAAKVTTILQDLDPSELTAPSTMTASARADPAGDVPGVPGWPFHLAQYQPIDEQ